MKIKKIKHRLFTSQFFLFILCGGCGTIVNFCFSVLFSQSINATTAYAGGYIISLFAAYALNASFIFKQPMAVPQFFKFVVSYIPNFIILFTFVTILLNVLHFPALLVYAGAAIFGLPVTFVLVKWFAFRIRP